MANSIHEGVACLKVDEFAATKLRDVIELLILYRDLILFKFPRSIAAPNSD